MQTAARAAIFTPLLLAAAYGVGWAHATLLRSDPPKDAHLGKAPSAVRLEFSEAVVPRTSRVELVAPDSQRIVLVLRADGADAKSLLADVPPLALPGSYRVEWRLVGPDGHAVTGEYGFTVDSVPVVSGAGAAPIADGQEIHEPRTDSVVQQAIRFFSSLSMVVVIGAVAFALFVLPGPGDDDFQGAVDGRLRAACSAGTRFLLMLAIARLLNQGVVLSGSLASLRVTDVADIVAGSSFGRGWLLQVAAAIAMLTGIRLAPSSPIGLAAPDEYR